MLLLPILCACSLGGGTHWDMTSDRNRSKIKPETQTREQDN